MAHKFVQGEHEHDDALSWGGMSFCSFCFDRGEAKGRREGIRAAVRALDAVAERESP